MAARAAVLTLAVLLALPAAAAAQQPPAQPLPVFDQGRVYAREADFQRAIAPYQAAISVNARNARAHYWLGVAYLYAYRQSRAGIAPYASGYLPRATASLRQAVQVDANFLPAYLALHDAFTLADNLEEAAKVMDEIAKRTTPAGLPYTLPSLP
ncbi:MAG TPA: tetratricopeptide repeat protein [bacterium]|nr:tetratricopeptide repeat protein [bacterium]